MRDCGCRWDGNLDGRLIRCKTHAEEHRRELNARKIAKKAYEEALLRP